MSARRVLDVLDMALDIGLNSRILKHTIAHRVDGAVLNHQVLCLAEQLLACQMAVHETYVLRVPGQILTIEHRVIDGHILALPERVLRQYLAWHSKNVRLVNCHLAGEQLLCYAQNLVLENCTIDEACDRMFEYSTVEADIRGHIEHIKNPSGGHIIADSIGSNTIDENVRQPNNCIIETRK